MKKSILSLLVLAFAAMTSSAIAQEVRKGAVIEFEKDGDLKATYSYSYTYYGQTVDYSYSYLGSWEWKENKNELLLEMDGDLIYATILKLTKDEFSFEDNDGDKWEFTKED